MEAQAWEQGIRLAALLLSLIGGIGAVPIIGYIKGALNADGRWAQVITAGVATVIAVLTLIVQGTIAPETVTLESAAQLLVAVLVASQAEYRRLKDKLAGEPAPE